jgi:hypothetical protein
LWRDQVRIALSPGRVVLVRVSRGLQPAISAQRIVPCALSTEAPMWHAPLAALAEALREPAWQRADAVVVLSNHFVRYALVPWEEKLLTEAEQVAFARYSFVRVYGETAEGWAVRQSGMAADSAQVAGAVDQELLDALRATVKPAGLRLTSIQPYLMHAYNRWQALLHHGAGWFAVGEPGRLCLALLEPTRWLALNSYRIGEDWPQALVQWLDRERHRVDATEVPSEVYLYAPDLPEASLESGGWSVKPLKAQPPAGFPPTCDHAYAMALPG